MFFYVSASSDPSIACITPNHAVSERGGTVEFDCSVQNAEDNTVIWIKLNPEDPTASPQISMGDQILFSRNKYSIRYTPDTTSDVIRYSGETPTQTYTLQVIILT